MDNITLEPPETPEEATGEEGQAVSEDKPTTKKNDDVMLSPFGAPMNVRRGSAESFLAFARKARH